MRYDAEHEQVLDQHYPAGRALRICGPDYADQAEDRLHDIYDGDATVVAVEVFDHPLAQLAGGDRDWEKDRGAWYVGEETAVMAALKRDGCEDWEVQYEMPRLSDLD